MKSMMLLGPVLIVLAVASLIYHGIPYTSRDTIIDIGPVHATAERQRTWDIPQPFALAVLAGGIGLLVIGLRKRA